MFIQPLKDIPLVLLVLGQRMLSFHMLCIHNLYQIMVWVKVKGNRNLNGFIIGIIILQRERSGVSLDFSM